MKVRTIVLYLSAAALLFLGLIFLIASVYAPTRIVTGLVLVASGFLLLLYGRRTGEPAKYVVELPSRVKLEPIKCPVCGGQIPVGNITVVSGITRAACPYCGKVSQISEEPKW